MCPTALEMLTAVAWTLLPVDGWNKGTSQWKSLSEEWALETQVLIGVNLQRDLGKGLDRRSVPQVPIIRGHH